MPMSFEDFQRLRKLFGGMGGPIGGVGGPTGVIGQALPTAPTEVRARGPVGARPTAGRIVSTPPPPAALYPNYRPLDATGQAQIAAGVAVPSRLPSGQPIAAFNLDYGLLPGSAQLTPGMAPVGYSPVNPQAPNLAERTAANFPFIAGAAGVTEGGVPYDENGIPIVTGPTGATAEMLNPQPNPPGGVPGLGFIPDALGWGADLLPESVTNALGWGVGKGMDWLNAPKNWEEERTGGMMYETAKSGEPQQPRENWVPTIWYSGPRQRYMTPDEPGYTPGKMVDDPGWFNEWALDNPDAVIAAYEDGYTPETGAYAGQALTGDRAVWELFINQQDQSTRAAMALLMDPATATSAAGMGVPSIIRAAEAAELAGNLPKARWLRGIATTIEAAEFATEAPVAAPARVLGAVAPPLGRATGRVAGAAGTGIESRFPGLGQAARRAGAFGERVGGAFVNPAPETAAADFSQRYGGELAQIEAARVRAEDLENLATGGPPPRGAEPPAGPPGEGSPDLVPSLFGGGPAAAAPAPTAPAPTVAVTTQPSAPQPRGYSRQRLSDGSWVVINPRGEVEQHIGNEFAWEAGRDPAEMADEFIAGLESGQIAPLPQTPTIAEIEQQLTGVPTPQQQAPAPTRNADYAPGWPLRRMNLAGALADDPAAAARLEQMLLPHATTLEQQLFRRDIRDVDKVIDEGRFAAESRIAFATEGREAPPWRPRFGDAPRQRRTIDVPEDAASWETVETLPGGQLVATMENPAKLIERLIHERSTGLTTREREVLRATGVIQSNPVRASLQDEILNARLLTSKRYPAGSLTIRNMPGQGYQKYDNVRLGAMTPAERQAVAAAAIAEKTAAYQRWQRIVDVRTRLHGPEAPIPLTAAGPIDEDVAPTPAAVRPPAAAQALPRSADEGVVRYQIVPDPERGATYGDQYELHRVTPELRAQYRVPADQQYVLLRRGQLARAPGQPWGEWSVISSGDQGPLIEDYLGGDLEGGAMQVRSFDDPEAIAFGTGQPAAAAPTPPATGPVTMRLPQAPTNAPGLITPPTAAPVAGNAEAIAGLQNDLAVMESALKRDRQAATRLGNQGITGPRLNQARQAETASKREVDRIRADLARLQGAMPPAAAPAPVPQAVGAAQPAVRLTPAGNELTGGPNRVWHVSRGDQRVEIYQPPGGQFRITGAGVQRRTPTLSEALVVADDMLAAPAPTAAAAETAPRIVQTPQGPQAEMDLGAAGRPVFGGPGGGFEVPPQTTAEPLELQLQVEPTPEAQRQAEVLAGQTDMFGAPVVAPTRQYEGPITGETTTLNEQRRREEIAGQRAEGLMQPAPAAAAPQTLTGDIPFVESQGVKSYDVPVAQIKTDPNFQPRQQLNPEHVARIRDKYNRALFEPITIWRNSADNQYYVLAGHHRLQAVRELGHAEVPARIFEGDYAAAKQFADRSNLHAAEQSVLENAGVIKREMEERGASYKQLASELGLKSANEAEQLHNLAYLPATIRTVFEGGGMRKAQAARFGAAVREGRLEAEHVLQIFHTFDQDRLMQLNVGQIDNALAGVEHLRGQQAGLFPLGPATLGGAPTLPGFAPSESDRILKDMIDLGARLTKLQTLEKRLGQVGRLGETTGVPVETSGALEAARAKIREISERLGRSYFVNPDVGRLGQIVGPRTTVSGIPPAATGNAELVDLAETVGLPPQAASDFSRMVTYEEEQLPLIGVYDRYKELVEEAHPEMVPSEVSAEAQRRFMGFLNETPDIARPQDYDPNLFLKGWDLLGENARAAIMYNIVTGPRGILGDWIGDNLLSTLSHGVDVFPSMNDPATIRAAGIFQYTGSQDAIRELPETLWLNDLGIPEHDRSIVNVRGGKAELKADDLMPLARGATKIPGFRTGIGRKVARTVVEPFQSELLRSGRSTLDLARRIGLFGHILHREFPAAANRFRRLVIQESERLGYNAGDLWNGIMAQAQTRVQGQGRVWNQQFDPADVTNALREAGISDTSLSQAWANEVRGLVEAGKSAVNRTLFSYRQMNVDKQLGRLIFFNYWQSRALVSWSRLALKHPAIGMHFARAYQGMEREAEEQGYPSSVRGWMGFMGDKGAFWSFFDPISMLTPYSMFRDTAPREDQRGWEKALSKWHVFIAPQLQAAANLMGWGTSAVDPTGTYSVRNTVRAVLDYDRNHGNHLGLGPGISEDQFTSLVNGVFRTASDLAEKGPIPFAEEIDETNPKATEIAQVNNIILSMQEDKYGPASTWEEKYDVLDENGVPTNRVINETMEAENAIRLDRAEGNELAEAALARWSGQGVKSTGLRSAIPGGVRTFFGPQERQRELKNQGFAAVAEGATPTPEEQAGMAWWEAGTAGTERGANVGMQQQQYADLGTERQQTAAGRWNDIAFATLQPGEEIMITGLHGNEIYNNTSLQHMTQEERENIANQWVEAFRATESLAELRDTQSAFREQNPEFNDLKEWQATARDYEDENGPGSWRREMSRVSPSYRAYINNLPGGLSKAELDKKAISADAYTAYLGEQQTIYETSVPPRLDIGQADPALFMQGGAGAGGGGGGEKDYTGDDVAYLESELADYMQKQQEYEQAVMSMTGGQAVDNPFFKTALDEELRMRGISEPRMPAIVENYASWIRLQQPGADLSPAAYIAWRDAQEAALIGQFAQPGGALAQFQQQYSQPYAAP